MYFNQILIAQPLLYLIETTASKQGRVWKTNFWNQPEVCARRFYLVTCSFGFPSTISLALFIKPWRLKKISSQIFCTISLAYKALLSENGSIGILSGILAGSQQTGYFTLWCHGIILALFAPFCVKKNGKNLCSWRKMT